MLSRAARIRLNIGRIIGPMPVDVKAPPQLSSLRTSVVRRARPICTRSCDGYLADLIPSEFDYYISDNTPAALIFRLRDRSVSLKSKAAALNLTVREVYSYEVYS